MERYLIDTNILIWWFKHDNRLNAHLINIIQENHVAVSIVSCWEVMIKLQIKKLQMPLSIREGLVDSSFSILDLQLNHVERLKTLDMIHRDPFDRIIIAQAIEEDYKIITSDKIFEQYPVDVINA